MTPVCDQCTGIGTDDEDGSECAECEGSGRVPFAATSPEHRRIVAQDFVEAWGSFVAMAALGFDVIADAESVKAARYEWSLVYRDAFGSVPERRLSAETTLAQAMRDEVAIAAVTFREPSGVQREVPLVEVEVSEPTKEVA
jgi:hypothetical protein